MATIGKYVNSSANIIEISDSELDDVNDRTVENTVYVVKKYPEVINVATTPNIAQTCFQPETSLTESDGIPSDDDVITKFSENEESIISRLFVKSPGIPQFKCNSIKLDVPAAENGNTANRSLLDQSFPPVIYQFDRPKYKQKIPGSTDVSTNLTLSDADGSYYSDAGAVQHREVEQKRRKELTTSFKELNELLYQNNHKRPQLTLLNATRKRIRQLKREQSALNEQLELLHQHKDVLRRNVVLLGGNVEEPLNTSDDRMTGNSKTDIKTSTLNIKLVSLLNHRASKTGGDVSPSNIQSSGSNSPHESMSLKSHVPDSEELTLLSNTSDDELVGNERMSDKAPSPNHTVPIADPSPMKKASLLDLMFKDATSSSSQVSSPVEHTVPGSSPKSSLLSQMFKDASSTHTVTSPVTLSKSDSPVGSMQATSLLGKIFNDVESSLKKKKKPKVRVPEPKLNVMKMKTPIIDNKNPPPTVPCNTMPPGLECTSAGNGLVLTKCTHCGERIAFRNDVPGYVVCPKCSTIVIQFRDTSPGKSLLKTSYSHTSQPVKNTPAKKSKPRPTGIVSPTEVFLEHSVQKQDISPKHVTRKSPTKHSEVKKKSVPDDDPEFKEPDLRHEVFYCDKNLRKRKIAPPEDVISIDSDSEGDSDGTGTQCKVSEAEDTVVLYSPCKSPVAEDTGVLNTPCTISVSDVRDVLKDGVSAYVDNVDGDEVIVVLK